jgi:hypothetical protein
MKPYRDHPAQSLSTHHEASKPRQASLTYPLWCFLHWHRLTCQQRLIDIEVLAREQPDVSGNSIPFNQYNKIAWDHLCGGNTALNCCTNNKGPRSSKRPQTIQNAVSALLLKDRDACAQ